MTPLANETALKEEVDLEADFIVLASMDSVSDDESLSDENDVFSVSCHGNHFKRLKEEPKRCDEFAIKRRKLHTQMDLMNSILMSMSFSGNLTSSDERPTGSVSFNKRLVTRKMPTKRITRKAKS